MAGGDVPVWAKYALSIEEAAEYFRIGQGRLRQLVAENPNADYILMIGSHIRIKRRLFEQFVDSVSTI